jgi:hypothetical protein
MGGKSEKREGSWSAVSRVRGSTQASCRRFRAATVGENERLEDEVVVKDL